MSNPIIKKLLKFSGSKTIFEDLFARNENPIATNGWGYGQSTNGSGFRIINGTGVYADSAYGIYCYGQVYRELKFNENSEYTFRFKFTGYGASGNAGVSWFCPFGVNWSSVSDGQNVQTYGGLVLKLMTWDHSTASSRLSLYNNGTLINNITYTFGNPVWIEMIVKPNSYVKFKYWANGSSEPTTYTTFNTTISKISDFIRFMYYSSVQSSTFQLYQYKHTVISN